LVVFRLGDRTYGIDLDAVREILRPRPASRLPGAPPAVIGLINVRGAIVTVIDLGVALGLRDAPAAGAVMLVEHGPKLVGAAVDEVLDVQRRADDGFDAAPKDVQAGGAVRAIGTHDGSTVVVLDIHDLLSHVLA
jgi:purine-binding chemotaxis protein CheW